MKRAKWVRVKSAAELRAGMAVKERRCPECSNMDHCMVFIRPDRVRYCLCDACESRGLSECPQPTQWEVAGCKGGRMCFEDALREGRLYRLDDDTGAEDYDETHVRREEKVR